MRRRTPTPLTAIARLRAPSHAFARPPHALSHCRPAHPDPLVPPYPPSSSRPSDTTLRRSDAFWCSAAVLRPRVAATHPGGCRLVPSLFPPDPPSCPCHTRPWHRAAIAQPRALTLRCVPPSPPLKAIAPPSNPLACRRPCRHALVPLPRIVALLSCVPHYPHLHHAPQGRCFIASGLMPTLARPRAVATHIHAAVSRPNGAASRLCECSRDAAGPRLASHAL
ncbi:hypothetical protein DENSPDRAFT_885476 [Dentipellis sp. KUC8613]|nr:hypothetical protein DENSPDRAFT_885476 [Dentipellis sp. KUC8613]